MNVRATIAQCLWAAGNLPDARRFDIALRHPEQTQRCWLMRRLATDAESAFGQEHDFPAIRSHRDFARAVPLRTYEDIAPWIERIRHGETQVLSSDTVTHLAPTSGSSGARKLIPFTATLHASFATAVGAWMTDLARIVPNVLTGSAYWSVSPLSENEEQGVVRVGFADDAEYLGGWKARLVRWVMAAPAELRHERDIDKFWLRTATSLLARRDLRLISVWHPSFFERILETAQHHWREILDSLTKSRAMELERSGPSNPTGWWSGLRVISAWGDLAAESGFHTIARRFPRCFVQPKGLLATEAVVSIPWRGALPLALTSHFFEFLTESGEILLAHELRRGESYELVVTNGGGLWRYRLGDLVECTGYFANTPMLRFLGRAGNVSDLRGEKLSEAFVAKALAGLWPDAGGRPKVAYLQPFDDGRSAGYELVVSETVDASISGQLDQELRGNPHYDLARRLGQLEAPLVTVRAEAARLGSDGGKRRLGDIKPQVLARLFSNRRC